MNDEHADAGERPYECSWKPTQFLRFDWALATSMETCRIVTDAGPAYIKAMGNREGPHHLACELVGTMLARWFGLETFDFAILTLDEIDEIPFSRGGAAAPGPAFITRAERGRSWGGSASELDLVVNRQDVSRLVVFDTWTRNSDRYPADSDTRRPNFDNVFLSEEGAPAGQFRLVAMDHSHCFTTADRITGRVASIDRVKDEGIYCLFPGFIRHLRSELVSEAVRKLREFDDRTGAGIVSRIPPEWEVSSGARQALCELIVRRAGFVAASIEDNLAGRFRHDGRYTSPETEERP